MYIHYIYLSMYTHTQVYIRSAAPDLAKGISEILGMPLGKATIGRFNDGMDAMCVCIGIGMYVMCVCVCVCVGR